jgi:putative effector of murein hydrolase LrgA (UPF0299 family)
MLQAFTGLLLFQLAGELMVTLTGLPVPGPVAGMALLFAFLAIRGAVPQDTGRTGEFLLSNLSLLFVPAGVGVMAHFALLRDEWPVLSVALIASTLAAVGVTAGLMSLMLRRSGGNDDGR